MLETGLRFQSRTCPRHGELMELCLDDARKNVSRLYWRCESCRGWWAEEYFYFRVECALPVRALQSSFSFPCPHCGSLDVCHGCIVGCCDDHGCNTCGKGFNLVVDSVEHRGLAKAAPAVGDALDTGSWTAVGGGATPYVEHSITLPKRHCDRHPDIALQFSSLDEVTDERFRFGWSCHECQMFYLDYMMDRTLRPVFIPASRPEIECPVCSNVVFDSEPDLQHAKCLSCGSILRLRATP